MKKVHLVRVHFDRRKPEIDQEWLNTRYKLFESTALYSLLSQTFQDFRIWFCCGAGMEGMVGGLREVAPENSLYTFGDPPGNTWDEDTLASISNADFVYVTRLDSDDLYSKHALQIAHDTDPVKDKLSASMFTTGYMYDKVN